uniref:Phosphodiesterase n=1 Tax=Globodera rostochiensis TaxID=31243 RepID=A0A914HM75_GLORO
MDTGGGQSAVATKFEAVLMISNNKLNNNNNNRNKTVEGQRMLLQQTTSSSTPSLIPPAVSSGAPSHHSSPSPSAAENRHNDPALYTALFKRKFVKVFTGWDLRASAERRWSRRGKLSNKQKAERSKSGLSPQQRQQQQQHSAQSSSTNLTPSSQRTSPCLRHCLECEVPTSKARVSNITFSTVTSATGLPTIAAEPSRPRSSSYWKPSHAHTVQNHHCGHNGGGIGLVTNISNSLPQRINFDEDEDGLNDQQQQHDAQGANDVAKKQFHKVGDGQRQQQRHQHQRRPVNEDGRDPSWQGVQQQQLQQQQRLLNSQEGTKEEEEEEEDEERQEAALATTSSSKLNETTGAKVHSAAFTNGGTRRVGIDSDQLHHHDGGSGVHRQQSSGSGDNTSLSSVATTTTTTTTTTAPYAHHDHAQSVDSDDMTGQPKSGFPSSTSSHRHKVANAAGAAGAVDVVGQQAKHHSKTTTPSSSSGTGSGGGGGGGGGRKSKSPRPIGPDEEYCNSEQSSSSLTAGGHLGAQHGLPAVYKTVNGTTFDRAELERDPTLRQVQEWSFPIFRLAEKHKRTVLSRLTYAIFKEADLFRTFKISYAKFFNYFHALESGYWDIPYHNRIHAADVLHGTYYLTCHPVHAFCGYHSSEMEDEDELEDEEEEEDEEGEEEDHHRDSSTLASCSAEQLPNREHQQQLLTNHQQNERTTKSERPQQSTTNQQRHFGAQQTFDSTFALPLAQSMSPLELMALYTAAAMHDYDHPGRTNAFLVASEDRKAILYNDRSVLENHHAAESWRLLNQAQNQFIENLDSAETKRFRYLVLEYILATDLKQHFDIIMQFNERVSEMDLSNESDRVLISLMLIKFADINSPAKPYSLHRQWTERICQEFYEQGHEEKKRQMPVSPYMDRNEPAVAKLQDSFIAHIVNPLAIALNEAGLFPVLPGLPESELIINLKHNHQKWLHQIEAEQEKEDSTASASSTAAASGGDGRQPHKARSNNIGAGGEAEMALNSNGGVKLPMFNNNFSSSAPSMAAKQQHKGSSGKSGTVVGYRARAATTTTTAPAPMFPSSQHPSPFVSHGAGGVFAGGAVRSASMSSREHPVAAAAVDDAAAVAAATTGKIVG